MKHRSSVGNLIVAVIACLGTFGPLIKETRIIIYNELVNHIIVLF